jgi:hypothetical protein
MDDNSFLEVFLFQDRSEISKRVNQHVYQRIGVLAISEDWEEWTFARRGMEDKIRLQRYKIKKSVLKENQNAVALQRLSSLRYGNISAFEDLFDRKDISNRFYREFNKQKISLCNSIQGIANSEDKKLYAQVLLDRLIFLFFLQSRAILDGKDRYFTEKFQHYSKKKNEFYSIFLKELFFEALCRKDRKDSTLEIVGMSIPYLNGGLFLLHELEEKYKKIEIPNDSFRELFQFFESWHWNVNERSETDEDSIDPYILGYIFENTLGENKSGGVYYTPPSLSEFLTDETIDAHIFSKVARISASGHYQNTNEFIQKATEPELLFFYEILRDLKIADPACGSGQFLVQSLHSLSSYHSKIAERIQKENWKDLKSRIEKDYSLEKDAIYGIRRFIASHNVYGVDLLPEACEITKLRLFLAMVEGMELSSEALEPLPNIDFHIRTGDSLTGFLNLPNDFFEGTLQAKKASPKKTSAKSKIKTSPNDGILDFGDAPSKMQKKENLIFLYTNEHDPERAVQLRNEIKAIDTELNELLNQRLEFLMNEWKVKPKTKIDFIDLKKDTKAKEILNEFVLKSSDLKPLHFGLEFSPVIHVSEPNKPGFDILLMNPPWEVLQPSSLEFFEQYIPEFRKMEKNQATDIIPSILKKDLKIKSKWIGYNSYISSYSELIRRSEFYSYSTDGKIDLYKLFLERGWNLLKEGGSLGIVIPSGFYSNFGSKDLRKLILENGEVNFLYGFENSKALFENVHRSAKFILLSVNRNSEIPGQSVPSAFMLRTEQDLHYVHSKKDPRFLDLPLNLIRSLSPDSLSFMEFQNEADIRIVQKIARFSRLGDFLKESWNAEFSSEFNMTTDSGLFSTKKELDEIGAKYDPETMIWKKGKELWFPLYVGRMIEQYDNMAASYVSGSNRSAVWDYLEFPKLSLCRPQFWCKENPPKQSINYKILLCDVTGSSNKRTGLSTLSPSIYPAAHSVTVIQTNSVRINLLFISFINSFVVDYFVRFTMPGNHYTMDLLKSLPLPRYSSLAIETAQMRIDKDNLSFYSSGLISAVARLVGTAPSFNELLSEVFGKNANHKTHGVIDPVERQNLKNQIDAMVAKIYDLTEEELKHILDTFPQVEDSIKEGVLEEWRKL